MKETVIIFTSYLQKFEKLSDEQFGQLMRAGLTYSATGEVPEIEDAAVALSFDVIKYEIDASNKKYEEVCKKRKAAGKKGGLAKANKAKQEVANQANAKEEKDEEADLANASKSYQELAKGSKAKQEVANDSKSSIHEHEHDNDHDHKKISLSRERDTEKASIASTASEANFLVPTLSEVKDYAAKRESVADAETFFDYYQARHWEGIKDWKAQFRVWEKREKAREPAESTIVKAGFKSFAQRKYDFDALEQKLLC